MYSAMMKAEAPMIGGMNCPAVEETASMAAAMCRLKPMAIISGMVTEPVVATFPLALPETMPISPLDTTATLAGPPTYEPAMALEKFMNRAVELDTIRKAANIMKKMIWFTLMLSSRPIIPSVPTTVCTTTLESE